MCSGILVLRTVYVNTLIPSKVAVATIQLDAPTKVSGPHASDDVVCPLPNILGRFVLV